MRVTALRRIVSRVEAARGGRFRYRCELGWLYSPKERPEGARMVLDIFERGGSFCHAVERPAAGPEDVGQSCEADSSRPDLAPPQI